MNQIAENEKYDEDKEEINKRTKQILEMYEKLRKGENNTNGRNKK